MGCGIHIKPASAAEGDEFSLGEAKPGITIHRAAAATVYGD